MYKFCFRLKTMIFSLDSVQIFTSFFFFFSFLPIFFSFFIHMILPRCQRIELWHWDTEKLLLIEQCPGPSSRCEHTSSFLLLELQRASDSTHSKWKFSWGGTRTFDQRSTGQESHHWAILTTYLASWQRILPVIPYPPSPSPLPSPALPLPFFRSSSSLPQPFFRPSFTLPSPFLFQVSIKH